MSCLVYGGSFAGLKSVQTRIITTGNTGRRIIMPIKQKYTRRFRKSIISTMVLMVTGAWKSIWNAEATLTVQLPFINIWIQSWDSIPLSAQRSLNMSTENRIKYSTINLIRISRRWNQPEMVYGLYISVPFESWGTLQLYHTRFARPKCGCQHYRPQDTSNLAIRTLQKALESQPPIKGGLILHSDQGSQFTSKAFVEFCESVNVTQSMSKAGYPYDNAPMERYFNTLKNECTNL